jgi:ribonucleoside-diphosphate reductase alpha chain
MREKQGVQQDLLNTTSPTPLQVETLQPKLPTSPVVSSEGGQSQFGFDAVNRSESFIGTCPDCGSSLEFAEGCAKCHVCGFSECG